MSFEISRNTGTPQRLEFLIENRVVQNDVNLLDGRKSTGKSSIVSKIISDWFYNESLPKERRLTGVLWLSSEENFDAIIKPRLGFYGVFDSCIATIDYRNGKSPRPILPQDTEKLAEFCKCHRINCIVIDPFSELKPADWSINDGDQMRTYMSAISSLCSRAQATAFCIRHMRKSSGPHAGDDGIGSVMIKNTVRLATRVDMSDEATVRRFWTVHESNIVKPTQPMGYELQLTDKHWGKVVWTGEQEITLDEIRKLSAEQVHRMKLEEAKRLLLEALKDGEKPCKDLIDEAETFGIGERTLSEAKARLRVWSDRRKDQASGKMFWVWGLPEHKSNDQTPQQGDDGVQLNLTDLPEYTEPAIKPHNPANIPDTAQLPDQSSAPKPKPKRTPKPKADPKPKPKADPKPKKPKREPGK